MGDMSASIRGDSDTLLDEEGLLVSIVANGGASAEGTNLGAALRMEPNVAPEVCVDVVILLEKTDRDGALLIGFVELLKLSNDTEDAGTVDL